MPKSVMRKCFRAKFYDVNCEVNDEQDIRCGGPQMLGFEFYVDAQVPEKKVITFIKQTLKKYRRPLQGNICIDDEIYEVQMLWTRKEIEACIKKGY